ncbi:MAG: type II toxin-antitoxin system HicA family toxin [Lachnospiraceae bacterium]|nr:type II toxin-antitoxin system HicA family toxin [Lachnospiraceae bacterium]
MTFREIDRLLRKDGWYEVSRTGSHHHYEHSEKPGKITVPEHAGRDLKKKTAHTILKSAGVKETKK